MGRPWAELRDRLRADPERAARIDELVERNRAILDALASGDAGDECGCETCQRTPCDTCGCQSGYCPDCRVPD